MVATISPSTLADLRRRGEKVTLIDVRTPAEFGEVHVDFARNIPLDRIDPKEIESLAGNRPVYFVCKSGGRSQKVGIGLAGFIGCGLVFAGVTDTCGMAMLIAKMPWNQACR